MIRCKSVAHRSLPNGKARARECSPPDARDGEAMATITKKELIDRIAEMTQTRRVQAKRVVQ